MSRGKSPQSSRRRSLPLPREHGSWVLLFGPTGLALLSSGRISPGILLLVICMTALFLAREPLVCLVRQRGKEGPSPQSGFWKKWLILYGAAGLLAGLPLILVWRLYDLLLLATPMVLLLFLHLRIVTRREERSLSGEWLGVLGLSLAATAVDVVSHGRLRPAGLSLWLISVAYFTSGLLHVRMCIARTLRNRKAPAAISLSVGFHVSLAVLLALLIGLGNVSPWLGLSFGPALLRAFRPLAEDAPARLNLKRIGYLEVCYSLLFVLCAGLALRWG